MDLSAIRLRPFKLKSNRVNCYYNGGFLLDKWQGKEAIEDGCRPEEWVASVVESRNSDALPDEGLSQVLFDEDTVSLRSLISYNPTLFLGESHVQKYNSNPGILVKIIDTCTRLMIQVHPDRVYSKKYLDSDYGKTEAWYIMGTRSVGGEEPYILLGFKPGITKEIWREMFYKQDIQGMFNALHRFPVKPGDVFLIKGGVPHAIGAGCFLIEVQEPTDYTMRVERKSPSGKNLVDIALHQGVGFEKMLDCFHYETYTRDEILKLFYKNPFVGQKVLNGSVTDLISSVDTTYFCMKKLDIFRVFKEEAESDVFSAAVILAGKGKVYWDSGEMDICQSDEIYFPPGISNVVWECTEGDKLETVVCYPGRT